MKTRIRLILMLAVIGGFLATQKSKAQQYNPIPIAVPSLQIAPDARGGGMGDIGAATMPDVYSQYWNAAKYPFVNSPAGFAVSYTPWLSKLVNDINLMYLAGYWQFGQDKLNVISASFRYFSLGNVDVTHLDGTFLEKVAPYELSFDMAYSRKLTETFSGAVTLRYIYADYSYGNKEEITPGNAFAADVSGYNEAYVRVGRSEALWGLGFNISNIGTKISYGNGNEFIPTNLRLGTSFAYPIDDLNTLSLSADVNKLLVPTPPLKKEEETDAEWQKRIENYRSISPIGGIFKSFNDAPGGFNEEMKEIAYSIGAEYMYDQKFALRVGFFNENAYKGNRKYMSFGAGFNVRNSFRIDAAYLVSTVQSNPLDQTLRLSLGFDLDGLRNLMR